MVVPGDFGNSFKRAKSARNPQRGGRSARSRPGLLAEHLGKVYRCDEMEPRSVLDTLAQGWLDGWLSRCDNEKMTWEALACRICSRRRIFTPGCSWSCS